MQDLNSRAFWLLLSAIDLGWRNKSDLNYLKENRKALDRTIAVARANGLYFPFVKELIRIGGRLSSQEELRWTSELQSRSEFQSTIALLNEISRRTGIEYILIKNSSVIENVPRDVDILVREQDFGQFIELLTRHGLKLVSKNIAEISLRKPGLMRIDIYARIHYLGRDFLDERLLWESRANSSTHGIVHPSLAPEAAYLLHSIHGLLGHGGITLLDFLELNGLESRIQDPALCREKAAAFGWGEMFDLWTDKIHSLQKRVYEEHLPVSFPLRLGRHFILKCVSSLDGHSMKRRERLVLGLSLFWDDLIHFSESSGLATILRRSELATGVTNSLGHRVRAMRGDRKA